MQLSPHRTKIVCTIGPASSEVPVIEEMIRSGMSVARINFSHGKPEEVRRSIRHINEAARRTGRIVGILADLPGAKIRLGELPEGRVTLRKGQSVTLVSQAASSSPSVIPVEYPRLSESVAAGGKIYINDGFIELRVDTLVGTEVCCTVVMGGTIVSHKGLNLPGARLFIDPVTPRDLELVDFGLDEGVDMFGVSFVESSGDILKIKEHARRREKPLFAVAKIERGSAVKNIDDILGAADAIMVARGDLGVEVPIEEVPLIQKQLIHKANVLGRPVITATQMLESMKENTRPTRAEVSDVANAILDGTDAVMLSEETAVGQYPAETVAMMSSIAAATENQRGGFFHQHAEMRGYLKDLAARGKLTIPDVISRNAVEAAGVLNARYILTPTETGNTARRVSRFKPPCWILAFSRYARTCRLLALSYGVHPTMLQNRDGSWHTPILQFLSTNGLTGKKDNVIIAEARFGNQPGGTDSMEILTIDR